MIRRRSLRRRAAFGIAALAIAVVSAHSIVLFSIADEQEDDVMDRIVLEELDHLVMDYQADPATESAGGQFLNTYIVRNAHERARLPAHLRDLPAGVHELAFETSDLHVGVRDERGVGFYVVYDVTHQEERIRQFGWMLLLGVTGTAVVAIVLGSWVAGVVVQPVTNLAARVQRLAPRQPPHSLATEFTDEEVNRLARAFDEYTDRLAELVAREREFTADVSHELRTPLTAIVTGCELLLQEPGLTPAARRRTESIQRAGERMSDIVRTLLFLARQESEAPETVVLAQCVRDTVEPLRPLFNDRSVTLEVDISSTATVSAHRTALALVLGNLLRNAIEHTERGFVRVLAVADGFAVEDSGHGIAPQDLPRIFERHYRGALHSSGGSGLGLAIVKRVCDRYGWRIEVASSAAGTRVEVSMTPPTSH